MKKSMLMSFIVMAMLLVSNVVNARSSYSSSKPSYSSSKPSYSTPKPRVVVNKTIVNKTIVNKTVINNHVGGHRYYPHVIHTQSSFYRNNYYYSHSPSYRWNGYSYSPLFHYSLLYGYWYFVFYNHDTYRNEMIKADSRFELQQIVYNMRDSW